MISGKRFKFLFPMSAPLFAKFYEELKEIRSQYRNVFAHSMPIFYVAIDRLRLVPFDYNDLFKPFSYPLITFQIEEAERILTVFEDFIRSIEENDYSKFAYLYCESGLIIHLSSEEVEKLKQHMSSEEMFKKELERRSYLQDAYDNMEI